MPKNGNPQLEDGHTRIANELLEAISSYPFTGGELKVVLAVIRLTYGWQKSERPIKQRELVRLTRLHPRYLHRVLTRLRQDGVLFRQRYSRPHCYALNKHYYGWKNAPQPDPPVRFEEALPATSHNRPGKSGQPGSEVSVAPGPWARSSKEIKKEKKERTLEPAVHNFLASFSQLLHRPLTDDEHALVLRLHELSPAQAQQLLAQAACATKPAVQP